MGNCQAVDTTSVVIQHPNGKEQKLSFPVSATYVMKMNPGHCISLLISTTAISAASSGHGGPLRLTRIKLLRPTDMLVLGHVYRLITTEEVMKGLMAKKSSKLKKGLEDKPEINKAISFNKPDKEDKMQMKKQEKEKSRVSRSWQPSLQSISERGPNLKFKKLWEYLRETREFEDLVLEKEKYEGKCKRHI